MKVLGIVVEYNPFHNGHIYHITKAKELIQPDITIAIMSGSFVQRGEPAIIDKWKRSQQAINFGVDLVIELPFVYSVQSADYFSKGAIDLLYHAGITDLCFGSENGNIDYFIEIAKTIDLNEELYQSYIKKYMKLGIRYPDACNKALSSIMQKEVRTPNDLLGLAYVKEIIKNKYLINLHCIKRTNDYHGESLENISSATSIRHALKNRQDVSLALPNHELYQEECFYFDDLYPLLKYQLLTLSVDQLQNIHLVEEGLEYLLKDKIIDSTDMSSFLSLIQSKRYTRPRLQRMMIHILMNNTKTEIERAMHVDYLRILSMNQIGQRYLNILKKQCDYHIIANFTSYKHPALSLELKATTLLSHLVKHKQNDFIKQEYYNHPYKK